MDAKTACEALRGHDTLTETNPRGYEVYRSLSYQEAQEIADFIQQQEKKLQRMQWISVKDRLPEDGAMVLILTKHKTIEVSWLKKDNWWYFRNSAEPFNFATHWMPLSEPPRN